MITNEQEYESAIKAIGLLHQSLLTLRRALKTKGKEHHFALLAEGPVDELQRLEAEVNAYISPASAELWIHLEGAAIEWGNASTAAITAIVDALRKGIQSLAEFGLRGVAGTKPSKPVRAACDLRLNALAPGSVRLGISLPAPGQSDLDPAKDPGVQARLALARMIRGVQWAAKADGVDLPSDPTERKVLLQAISLLVPREGGGISSVDLLPRGAAAPVILRHEARERIQRALTAGSTGTPVSLQGVVREIDLDKKFFRVNLADGNQRDCLFGDEHEQVVTQSLDRLVRVAGIETVKGLRRREVALADIEIVEEDGPQESPE